MGKELRQPFFKIGIISVLLTFFALSYLVSYSWGQTITVPLVSTRGHFDLALGQLSEEHNGTDYRISDIPDCPSEIAIFVHAWGLNETLAVERYDRTLLSLQHNNYSIPLILFSWDANTNWTQAKQIAKDNGPKLAHFIIDYMSDCKNEHKETKIRLISHSLGARVILSGLDYLHRNNIWNENDFNISSVNLLGAAVDNEEVSKNIQDILLDITNYGTVKTTAYGQAIEEEVLDFYNLYDTEDNYLEPRSQMQIYPTFEFGDWALGQNGYQTYPYSIWLSLPVNYEEKNVEKEILPICDADGNKELDFPFSKGDKIGFGDNHLGYIGFRNSTDHTKLIDDGAMNIVVDYWNNIEPELDSNLGQASVCR